ncbi:1972_t:CDS:2, partial [Acaulospora morrowiae]
MTTSETRWESRLPYFENNETWKLIDFLQWSIAFTEDFGDKQDEHLLYKVCLEKLRLKPQLLKSRDGELVQQLVSCCMKSFEMDTKLPEVKGFWESSSTVMKVLKKASVKNSKNMINQVLNLHTDFSEALLNTTREMVKPALKRGLSSESSLSEEETVTDADSNSFLVSEHEKDSNNATANQEDVEVLTECIKLQTHKRENEIDIEGDVSCKRQKSETNSPNAENPQLRNNSEKSFSESLSSSDDNKELEEDEEIKFDLTDISIELRREQIVKWEVGCINITDRFRQYQKD